MTCDNDIFKTIQITESQITNINIYRWTKVYDGTLDQKYNSKIESIYIKKVNSPDFSNDGFLTFDNNNDRYLLKIVYTLKSDIELSIPSDLISGENGPYHYIPLI